MALRTQLRLVTTTTPEASKLSRVALAQALSSCTSQLRLDTAEMVGAIIRRLRLIPVPRTASATWASDAVIVH